jgi:hypothetical protein
MKWTKEQMEAIADLFAHVFVESVEHAGGTATIVESVAAQQRRAADVASSATIEVNSDSPAPGSWQRG